MPRGDKLKFSSTIFFIFSTFPSSPFASLIKIDNGFETPIAYANCIKHFSEAPEATMFFAKYLETYAADLSTLVGSLPENAPPPCGAAPPYVSTIIFLPVSPVSPSGPPIINCPVGFI